MLANNNNPYDQKNEKNIDIKILNKMYFIFLIKINMYWAYMYIYIYLREIYDPTKHIL